MLFINHREGTKYKLEIFFLKIERVKTKVEFDQKGS